jgi:uncharacterized SAM-binding protein YcdF (DUF218 family)
MTGWGNVLQRLKLQPLKLQSLKTATKKRWFWRGITIVVLILIILLGTVTARLYVWPPTGMPAKVDVIVVLGGSGDRLDYATQLAREDRAPYLVLSKGLGRLPPGICTEHVGSATVLCFQPNPDTTQGESEGFAKLAEQHSWHSVALVTSQEQAWRAKLWFNRCYPSGQYYSVGPKLSLSAVIPSGIIYEWGATVKAEVFDRSC